MKNEELLKLHIRFYLFTHVTEAQAQNVLALIDSPVFLKEVATAREVLNIKRVPVVSNEAILKIGESVGIYYVGLKKENINDKHIGGVLMETRAWLKVLETWQSNNPSLKNKLNKITNKILKRLNCGSQYITIIQQAILLGIIGFSNKIHFFVDGEAYFASPTYIILVRPDTTDKQVKEALKNIRGHYFQPRKKADGTIVTPKKPPYYPKIFDYHTWYWKRVEGLTYAEIVDYWISIKKPEIDYDKRYKSYVNEHTKSKYKSKLKSKEEYIDSYEKMYKKIKIPDETEIIKGVKKYEKLLLK